MAAKIFLIFILFLSLTNTQAPPGSRFDLRPFKLQLPLPKPSSESVLEIFQPELNTYSSEYFYTDVGDLGMTFWAPVNGHTTPNSNYPRTELRETAEWTFSGTDDLTVKMRVLQEPPSGKVAIGQIRMGGSGSCSIVEELIWESGRIQAHQRDSACKDTPSGGRNLGTYGLGELITFSMRISGKTLTVTTDQDDYTYSYSWMNTGELLHFKTGAYVQDSGSSSCPGGKVKIVSLKLTHT